MALAIFAIVVIPIINLELESTAAVGRVSLERQAHYLAIYTLDTAINANFHGDKTEESQGFTVLIRSTSLEKSQYPIERVSVGVYQPDADIKVDAPVGSASAYRLRSNDQSSDSPSASPSASPSGSASPQPSPSASGANDSLRPSPSVSP